VFFTFVAYVKATERKKSEGNDRSSENTQSTSNKENQKSISTLLLDLAMDWNCIDVAKEYVIKNSLDNIGVLILISFSYVYDWFI
jgi:hypothetical protein